jgi:hypothetical protein
MKIYFDDPEYDGQFLRSLGLFAVSALTLALCAHTGPAENKTTDSIKIFRSLPPVNSN